jgi:hypothetical protein
MDANDTGNPVNYLIVSATGLDATYDDIRVAKEQ